MLRLTENIYAMNHDDDTDQPYVYLIRGERFSLQIDAGNSPRNYRRFLEEVKAEGLMEPKLLALTHWHWDHSFGLPAVNIPVISSEMTNAYLQKVMRWKWREEAMKERVKTGEDIAFCFEKMHAEYEDVRRISVRGADIVFAADFTVDLGNIHVHGLLRDSPHTRDGIYYWVKEERALIAGDGEYEDYYDYDSRYEPQRLRNYISFLEELDFDWYLRGHDEAKVSKEAILLKLKTAYQQVKKTQ